MGYRATVITQHREYGSQTFCDWSNFTNNVVPALNEAGCEIFGNDAEDFFEVEKADLQKFVDSLPKNDEPSISEEHTNNQLREELQTAINESNGEWVCWEWY